MLTEPKAIIPNTEPNPEGVLLHYLSFWVAIYNSRVGIAFGSVLQTRGGSKYMKMKGVASTNPVTRITFHRTIAHQIWIQVFKWDRDIFFLKEESQFWAVQSEAS